MTLRKILDDLSAHIEHTVDEGTTSITLDPASGKSICDGFRPYSEDERRFVRRKPVAGHTGAKQNPQMAAGIGQSVTEKLATIAEAVASCRKCPLHSTRKNTVPGQGSPVPEIMFIGEAPGADEDIQGLAFVGRAGQLLTKMIEAMGYTREQVFIANILKCRPPGNATPLPEQMEACFPYLKAQIDVIKPKVIITLGAVAARGLLKSETGITRLRGSWRSYEEIPVMPTYHPSYLLRNPSAKREVWEDLKEVLRSLGKEPPKKRA